MALTNVEKARKIWCDNRKVSLLFTNQKMTAPNYNSSFPSSDPIMKTNINNQFSQPCVILSLSYFSSGFLMTDGTNITDSPSHKILTPYNNQILTAINNAKAFEIIDLRDNIKYGIIYCDNIDLENKFITILVKREGKADRIYNQ